MARKKKIKEEVIPLCVEEVEEIELIKLQEEYKKPSNAEFLFNRIQFEGRQKRPDVKEQVDAALIDLFSQVLDQLSQIENIKE